MIDNIERIRKIAGITESEQKETEFGAYSIDSLITELTKIKNQYGNIGIASRTFDNKWNTEGVSIEIKSIHAYNQTSLYACFDENS